MQLLLSYEPSDSDVVLLCDQAEAKASRLVTLFPSPPKLRDTELRPAHRRGRS